VSRTTVDFGIDLGTTNSSIALLKGADVEVFRNNEGFEYTPSAVWIDRKGKLYIGRQAKEHLEDDDDNATSEFKLQMGTTAEKIFLRSGKRMKPEELSAEVLKALRADVQQRSREEIDAAVITVPAAFEHPQCAATNRAARLAGLSSSPLLQEPVAAALAYGFQSEADKAFWLVYDLGGGTFDAAVMQVRDGLIQVVNHGGDNHLGGKLIDWAIVDDLFVPALAKEYDLGDFSRGTAKWRAAFAKLKAAAETGKIRVSRAESAEVLIDSLGVDGRGNPIRLEYELTKQDVERIAEPFITRSINICKKVLAEKRLRAQDIGQILLVGGPTLMPYLRGRLEDSNEGLGVRLNFSVDPLTVVARGAAIFAGTQRIERASRPVGEGKYSLVLDYKPVGADPDPLVGGKLLAPPGATLTGFTVEFVNAEGRPPWRSGKIPLNADGTFITNLWAEKGRQNTFLIELRDASGNKQDVAPDQLSYTIGLAITDPPLIHTIGVEMVNNEVDVFFPKGTPLPARRRVTHRTALPLRRGHGSDVIRIPVVEGEYVTRADRNKLIGQLLIAPGDIKRDVPAGSEVEITIEIDQSRLIKTKAYIPILDEEYEDVMKLEKTAPQVGALKEDVDRQKKRLEAARIKAQQLSEPNTLQVLQRIRDENMLHEVESALAAAAGDRDAADKCQNRLLDLKAAIDEIEDALDWPGLVVEARGVLEWARGIVAAHGGDEEKRTLAMLQAEIESALASRQVDEVRRKVDEIRALGFKLVMAQPGWWVGYFNYLKEQRQLMSSRGRIDALVGQGDRAINGNDLEGLQSACRQLNDLLPEEEQEKAKGYGGTTHR